MTKQLKVIAEGLKDKYPLTAQYVNGIYGLANKLSWQMSTNRSVFTAEDFFQVMIVEACKLEPKFDTERGTSFYSFINRPLRIMMFREFVQVDANTPVYKVIKNFIRDYENKHKTYPSVEIISESTDIAADLIRSSYYGKENTVSIEALGEDGVNVSASAEPTSVNPKDFIEYLEPMEQMVIDLMYSEIPEDVAASFTMQYLSISKSSLETIHARALEKLKQAMLDYN